MPRARAFGNHEKIMRFRLRGVPPKPSASPNRPPRLRRPDPKADELRRPSAVARRVRVAASGWIADTV